MKSKPHYLAAIFVSVAMSGSAISAPPLPPDEAYVTVTGTELRLHGERVRFWGFIGGNVGGVKEVKDETPEARAARVATKRKDLEIWASRIADLGFNMVRGWGQGAMWDGHDYEPGDGSAGDMLAYYHKLLDDRGVKLWITGANGLGSYTADDVDVIDDPATAEAWQAAVKELMAANKGGPLNTRSGSNRTDGLLIITDPRSEAIFLQRLQALLAFPNKYKDGLRLGDDPQAAVWELVNEQFPFRLWFGGHWQALPPFFLEQITSRWHDFLQKNMAATKS